MTNDALRGLDGGAILWVASSGGHIRQAVRWAKVLGYGTEGVWATSGTPQTRDLLKGYRAFFLNPVKSREVLSPLRFLWQLLRKACWRDVHTVISTGASVAVTSLTFFALFTRKRVVYIESLTRVHRPSLSGRIVSKLPRVELYSPHETLGAPWTHLDPQLRITARSLKLPRPGERGLKIFVTSGTTGKPIAGIDVALKDIAQLADQVIVQGRLPRVLNSVTKHAEHFSHLEMQAAIDWADVVVCHAGVGTVLDCLERGMIPVTVPRDSRSGEHVDNHQLEFVDWLLARGLATNAVSLAALLEAEPRSLET